NRSILNLSTTPLISSLFPYTTLFRSHRCPPSRDAKSISKILAQEFHSLREPRWLGSDPIVTVILPPQWVSLANRQAQCAFCPRSTRLHRAFCNTLQTCQVFELIPPDFREHPYLPLLR